MGNVQIIIIYIYIAFIVVTLCGIWLWVWSRVLSLVRPGRGCHTGVMTVGAPWCVCVNSMNVYMTNHHMTKQFLFLLLLYTYIYEDDYIIYIRLIHRLVILNF